MSSLFLKYRPQTFQDVVGQTSVIQTLRNALKAEKPSHAYLFSGSRGTGKTSTARIFAKGLNCTNMKDGNPCGTCDFCHDTAEGTLVDVIEIDAASNRGIDEIRDLREKIRFAPNRAKRKVYIIDEVHMLTKEAFNALLKTLEEPPSHAFFLLATTEMHKLPETIISRCQTFIFNRFSLDQLVGRLQYICKQEHFKAEDIALQLIARKAEGGLRDAISLLEQIAAETENNISQETVKTSLGISDTETLEQFWKSIQEKKTQECLTLLRNVSHTGKDLRTFGHDFLGFLREQLHTSLENRESLILLLEAVEAIEVALGRLKTSPIVELPLEIAIIKLCNNALVNESILQRAQVSKNSIVIEKKTQRTVPIVSNISDKKIEKSNDSEFFFEGDIPHERKQKKIDNQDTSDDEEEGLDDLEAAILDIEIDDQMNISSDTISDRMPQLADKAGIPSFAKKSFLTTKPRIEGMRIIFQSDSHFHLEKLNKENVRMPLQKALIEMLEKKILIDFEIAKIQREVATADDFLNF
ncbi:DNA polymerase III subunit gamma/tau [Candidatus Gracilibacteria bacterium]|nr:DNA polymerase III subunit gamma/tau [Candidatus Gracilibacteria bacterium]